MGLFSRSQRVVVVFLSLTLAAGGACAGGVIGTSDGRFVDGSGRHVILHGVNVGFGDRRDESGRRYGAWADETEEDFAHMRAWGLNCVRLVLFWASVEPECGQYDEAFLDAVAEKVAWAKAHDLEIILDFHQDLWGIDNGNIGRGMPGWATLDGGRAHVVGEVWSDAYFQSPAILAAFDSFWANAPGPDGVGIQDRFALAWKHVAERFASEPAVLGYDLLNEAGFGSEIRALVPVGAPRTALALARALWQSTITLDDITAIVTESEKRPAILRLLDDPDLNRSIMGSAGPMAFHFERTKLHPMYQRVANAIREVDSRHILFLEPNVLSNAGVPSKMQPVLGADGRRDAAQALAPHVYDLTTDTSYMDVTRVDRLAFTLDRRAEQGRFADMPVLVGEWGAYVDGQRVPHGARAMVEAFERHLFSETYWYFRRDLDAKWYFDYVCRPFPEAVAGIITGYGTDAESGAFWCEWNEDGTIAEPSCVFVPTRWYPNGFDVTIEPQGQGYVATDVPGAGNTMLEVAPLGEAGARRIEIHGREK
ncbi:MAG TPA: cellulase family glycosylhydrolase [Candidatus Hydrogenedentes bacterium]|nr:cellulase family glycosylhydrolase [Candidatus Hydrogenedentota bacterium]HPG68825.1 cellulase family glycosylhydrolase [Candidatus Hydrogenedentota bacterium]